VWTTDFNMLEPRRHELRLPDLGSPGPARLSLWLVEDGSEVTQGDRLVEVLVGNATVDLPAPASGVLRQTLGGEDEPVVTGQVLGIIEEMGSRATE
jgi:pyruvate/2-oxoglutarate dehydrogenase complex dihydrolipoamide acyltransferase (E2) component